MSDINRKLELDAKSEPQVGSLDPIALAAENDRLRSQLREAEEKLEHGLMIARSSASTEDAHNALKGYVSRALAALRTGEKAP